MESYQHKPVLLNEVLENLIVNKDGIYIDGTFGRGGHAQAILQQLSAKGFLLAIDKDPEAITIGKDLEKDKRFHIEQGSFADINEIAEKYKINGKVDGILLDLGVSSPQLDDPKRGFSFLQEGPLDMRMDPTQGMDAATWLNQAKESEIAVVLKEYGEERYARRIARAISHERQQQAITTTLKLAEIVTKANPKWEKHKHPATRSFQAIRIFINKELEELQIALQQALNLLKVSGRLAVISFHSLEDRIVKRFIRKGVEGTQFPIALPVREQELTRLLRKVGKAIKPSAHEIAGNPRARSAILRVTEKISDSPS